MTKKQINRAEEILYGYFNEEHSERIRRIVQDWLAFEKEEKGKDAALWALFDDMVDEDLNPDRWSYEMLNDLRMRIAARKAELLCNESRAKRRIPLYRSNSFIRFAAVLIPAALIVGGMFWMYSHRLGNMQPLPQADFITMNVPDTLGARNRTELPDGSSILVKPGSRIAYAEDFGYGDTRRVQLTGEAYFDVSKDSLRRFVVETGHLNVNVLGTAFHIETTPDNGCTVVALYRGSVHVNGMSDGSQIALMPNQRLIYDHATGVHKIEQITSLLPEWITDNLTFENASYASVFRTMEWYFGVTIEVDGTFKREGDLYFRYTGKENIETAMQIFRCVSREFDYEITGDTVKIKVMT